MQSAGRPFHVIAKVGQHSRLVDDDVRELRQALLGVLDAPCSSDPGLIVRAGSPIADLVDPVGLVDQPAGQSERLEHLHGSDGDPVGLTHLEGTVPPVDDDGRDIGESGHLRSQDETGRTAPDDQDIYFLGRAPRRLRY